MEITITLPPEASRSPNKTMGRSFWVYKNHKDKCLEMFSEWCNAADSKTIFDWTQNVAVKEPSVHILIEGYGCRPKDCDNLVAGCKAIIDVLRNCSFLVDDNPTKMTLSVMSKKVSKKKDERLELTLSITE